MCCVRHGAIFFQPLLMSFLDSKIRLRLRVDKNDLQLSNEFAFTKVYPVLPLLPTASVYKLNAITICGSVIA